MGQDVNKQKLLDNWLKDLIYDGLDLKYASEELRIDRNLMRLSKT